MSRWSDFNQSERRDIRASLAKLGEFLGHDPAEELTQDELISVLGSGLFLTLDNGVRWQLFELLGEFEVGQKLLVEQFERNQPDGCELDRWEIARSILGPRRNSSWAFPSTSERIVSLLEQEIGRESPLYDPFLESGLLVLALAGGLQDVFLRELAEIDSYSPFAADALAKSLDPNNLPVLKSLLSSPRALTRKTALTSIKKIEKSVSKKNR